MYFINLLNETSVTYIRDIGKYGWLTIEGEPTDAYEAISWTGEIRVFTTYARANEWRVREVTSHLHNLIYAD